MTDRSFSPGSLLLAFGIVFASACGSSGPSHGGGTAGASGGGVSGDAGATPSGTAGADAAGAPGTAGDATGAAGAAPDGGAGLGGDAGTVASTPDAAAGTGGADGVSVTDPGTDGDGVFQIASPFKAAPEMSDQPGVAKGTIVQFTMATNTTFNDGSRKVAVYIPAGYVSGTEVPFMVAQDGVGAQNGGSFGLDDLRPLMDNMIAAKMIPMMAGVFVDPGAMRSVEYDTVSDKYWTFVETELLPAAIAQVQTMKSVTLNLTKDPEGRGAFGGSSGGAAAFTMGWFHPESYRRILTLSGSFLKLQSSVMYPNGAGDYAMTLIPTSAVLPLRIFMEAGSMDLGGTRWRDANDAMSAALMTKGGYHYRYIQAAGAMHEDDGARRQYLPAAMQWLWRGYPIK
ncbi:MAG TPA: alpha/beta hydrolase-fold protein [Polyangia bacterium]|jgi:enterochelin esterase-like enzyme|nr:alpha/beta hydrolase-fold protein [Polyangia bacterium]